MATISFARGVPAPECLPVEELADCARVAIERDGRTILFLAQHLAPGKRVLAELPTYDRPLKILRELGSDVELLACDDEGLDPDALEQALRGGPAPAFLYLIPTFQNPSGRTLSLERRRRIVELAQEHDLLVLEDDPYGLVRYEGEALPSLFELSGGDVVYSSSFSKTIGPGLRVGWFVFPEALATEIEAAATATYITPVLLGQATVNEFVRRGSFEPNLERVRGLLGARRDAMLEALDRDLPAVSTTRPAGGYFLWLELGGVDASDLLVRAEEAGVTFVKGTDFGGAPDTARLAFSFVSPDEIRDGVARLAAALPVTA
jgi:2-aminoadipate transaminase